MKVFPGACLLAGSTVLTACAVMAAQPPQGEPESVEEARVLWRQQTSSRYQFSFRQECFCTEEQRQTVRVTVDSGEVTDLEAENGDGPVPDELAGRVKTVSQWFAFIDGREESESARLEVIYNPQLGYPERIFLDRHVRMADDEVTWHLGDFEFMP